MMITLEDYITTERLNGTQVFELGKMFDADDSRILIGIENQFLDGHVTLYNNYFSMGIKKEYGKIIEDLIIEKMKRQDVEVVEKGDGSWNFSINNKTSKEYIPFWIELLRHMEMLERKWINRQTS